MSESETPISELMHRMDNLPSSDDIDDLTDAVEDLSKQIAASSSGAGIDRDEIAKISREEAMRLLEHLVSTGSCETERCLEFQQDLVELVNEMDVPDPEEDVDDSGSDEEGSGETDGKTDDDEREGKSGVEESEIENSSGFPPEDW